MVDIAGNRSWYESRRILAPNAVFVGVGGSAHTVFGSGQTMKHLVGVRLASIPHSQRAVLFLAKVKGTDMRFLQELLEAGKITPVIDRRYELSEIAAAFGYMGEGHAKGKIVIQVSGDDPRPVPSPAGASVVQQ